MERSVVDLQDLLRDQQGTRAFFMGDSRDEDEALLGSGASSEGSVASPSEFHGPDRLFDE